LFSIDKFSKNKKIKKISRNKMDDDVENKFNLDEMLKKFDESFKKKAEKAKEKSEEGGESGFRTWCAFQRNRGKSSGGERQT